MSGRRTALALALATASLAAGVSCDDEELAAPPVVAHDAGSADTGDAVDPGVDAGDGRPDAGDGGSDAGDASPRTLSWVDPARCVQPCEHPDESDLVSVDEAGALVVAGPGRISRGAQPSLAALVAAARADGEALTVGSAFRTYAEQSALYVAYAAEPGRAARPGHSEHELGLAVDLGLPDDGAATWVREHAHEHGWLLSYPQGKERQTGFRYEPWHIRFLGADLASEIHASGLCLEEWLQAHPDRGVSGDCSDCTDAASHSDCSTTSLAGSCDGSLLTWCFDGALARVDCASSSLSCDATTGDAACRP